ncbi:hypothetical protein DDL59_00605 [Neisseria gonorrhoeae]|uniref:Uncharacterized protein n=2 Tax=Neisseria gonorrhoeae TaxID=485 RepID=A0A0H4ISJ3_NEIG1|nr:hypothetical protein NGO_00570 [Neisseria gonorrhoeae FA 1090]AVH82850.1 hypothetical protein A6J43_13590 [Neisseria gonorrhoeae]EEH61401.1 conserved hypothetical protein [Neisseria gonorrhoeae 1291]EEZ49429.1 conserved hypothetical protein [Neisseria gonorrhoeae PID18]EEZ51739.1 conserved hypothetical protein [Neisseria gonorrhoeae PID1]EEZ54089.1 conserved hypothetical protein [Neisseria gonorrhoeae PID332]EEZ56256.1 conserved hypothetical protein [Neisseria gonorrhoeae SK-92-679]EEZ585
MNIMSTAGNIAKFPYSCHSVEKYSYLNGALESLSVRFVQAKKFPHQAGLDCSGEPHRFFNRPPYLSV